jgi:hypothetical protein
LAVTAAIHFAVKAALHERPPGMAAVSVSNPTRLTALADQQETPVDVIHARGLI